MKYFYFLFLSLFSFAQITLVKDINPGITASTPTNLFNWNGTLLFRAADGTNGIELWKSDGTTAGTVLVKNIEATASNSNPANFTILGSKVLFNATNGSSVNGAELWETDGTTAGTVMIKDINAGTTSSNPQNFLVLNPTTLLFSANEAAVGSGELWKTDGTASGTVNVIDYTGTINGFSSQILHNGVAYQAQIVNGAGRELYKSDGTSAGSGLVKEINATGNGISGTELFSSSTGIYFSGDDNSGTGSELWKSDGTNAGTVLVKDINSGATASSPKRFVEMGGFVYFNAAGANGTELWKTDGTSTGTTEVTNLNTAGNSDPLLLSVIGGKLYYFATDNGTNYDLYTFDGTTNIKLFDFNSIAGQVATNFVLANGKIFFAADSNADSKRELWYTDGTPAGTSQVAPTPNGITNLTLVGTNLMFGADDGATGLELYKLDPTTLGAEDIIFSKNIFSIYPNPSKGSFSVKGISKGKIAIFSADGKNVFNSNFSENVTVNSNLTHGIYIIQIQDEENKITNQKLIIK